MKRIIKTIFNKLGFDIVRMTKPLKSKANIQIKYQVNFLNDEKFEIEFKRLLLSGDQYFVPKYALHRPAVRKLLSGELYEPDTHNFVNKFCKSFKGSMVHAGTFFGDMLPSFSKCVSGYVYAFEPVLENYILAKLCVEFNNLKNVILMNCALSDDIRNLYIKKYESDGKHAGGASHISDDGTICVTISIDNLNIDDLVLIQLDVEGHEISALKGAQATIRKNRPVIAIEDNSNNCSEFLLDIKYEKVGQLPGLTIWSPIENNVYKEKIVSILT